MQNLTEINAKHRMGMIYRTLKYWIALKEREKRGDYDWSSAYRRSNSKTGVFLKQNKYYGSSFY